MLWSTTMVTTAAAVRLRVLVVDDQADVAEMITRMLVQAGHDCRVAYSGHEAITRAASFHPHVALLDIDLPDITGYDVARAIRALPGGEHTYLAAVTGWGQNDDQRRAFEAGFDQHIIKPAKGVVIRAIVVAAAQRLRSTTPP